MSSQNDGALSPSSHAHLLNLESALLNYKQQMLEHGVRPEDMRVVITPELRAMVNESEWPLFLRRLEEKFGQMIDIINPGRDASYCYAGTLRDFRNAGPLQRYLVVNVRETSLRLLAGQGCQHMDEALGAQGFLPVGLDSLTLEDPFGPIDVALAREATRALLQQHLGRDVISAVRGSQVVLAMGPLEETLFRLVSSCDTTSGAEPNNTAFSAENLVWYLSPEGLGSLQQLELSGDFTCLGLSGDAIAMQESGEIIRRLPALLILLCETAALLQINVFHPGSPGSSSAGMLDEMIRDRVERRMRHYGRLLNRRYRREYPEALRLLRTIFPDVRIRGRAKDAVSIADKLVRKGSETGQGKRVIRGLEDAHRLIGDGHGLRLVLEDTARGRIEQIRDRLLAAIQEGLLQVIEINNSHAGGADALPYFTEEDIARVRLAAEKARRQLPIGERPASVRVVEGPGAHKPSGYTTTQLKLRLRNPLAETSADGAFTLPCELQIRGVEVERFSTAEHLIHDIRREKDLCKHDPRIRERFEPEVTPLLEAMDSLSEADFRRFTDYLSRYYLHCRRLECGYVVPEPELPEELPDVCRVSNIQRLSRLQRNLITRYRHRPKHRPVASEGGQVAETASVTPERTPG